MRYTNNMLHRTIPEYRHSLVGAILLLSTAGCGWDSALQGHDLSPSPYAIERGYPELKPVSNFRIADYIAPDPTDLHARFAMLKRKIIALRGPVLSPRDRARINAALERRANTQG
jgi:hypothetical protein